MTAVAEAPTILAPGSVDLPVVGGMLDRIAALPAPGVRGLHDPLGGTGLVAPTT